MSQMQHIPPASLADLPSRVQYLHSFLSFNPSSDGPLINSLKPVLAPLLPTILDAVYTQLLRFDITTRSFLPAQAAQDDNGSSSADAGIDEKDVSALSLEHANIKHRQDFLRAYLVRVLSNQDWSPESKIWEYLDNVGLAHTGARLTAKKHTLRVEYAHMALLLGWVQDAIVGIVMGMKDGEGEWTVNRKVEALQALGKFWWIQNDLFSRHYCEDRDLQKNEKRRLAQLQRPETQLMAVGAAGLVTGAILFSWLT